MFSGIVEAKGKVLSVARRHGAAVLRLSAPPKIRRGLKKGDSISVCGVCLTVRSPGIGRIDCDLLAQTRRKTTLGKIRAGAAVNLERSLRFGDRMGGHFLYGHVDGIGSVAAVRRQKSDRVVTIRYPAKFAKYLVEKGSVGADGVSLTVAYLNGGSFRVHLIPHTLASTTLGGWKAGDKINLEFDVAAKYLWKWKNARLFRA